MIWQWGSLKVTRTAKIIPHKATVHIRSHGSTGNPLVFSTGQHNAACALTPAIVRLCRPPCGEACIWPRRHLLTAISRVQQVWDRPQYWGWSRLGLLRWWTSSEQDVATLETITSSWWNVQWGWWLRWRRWWRRWSWLLSPWVVHLDTTGVMFCGLCSRCCRWWWNVWCSTTGWLMRNCELSVHRPFLWNPRLPVHVALSITISLVSCLQGFTHKYGGLRSWSSHIFKKSSPLRIKETNSWQRAQCTMSTLLYGLATMPIFQVSPTVIFSKCFIKLLRNQLRCWYGPQYKRVSI